MTEAKTADKPEAGRASRKTVYGTVVSDKGNKTRVVTIARRVQHTLYGKVLRRRTKIYVHDERNESKDGDLVEAQSTRPLSKLKRWRLVRVVKQAVRIESGKKVAEEKKAEEKKGEAGS